MCLLLAVRTTARTTRCSAREIGPHVVSGWLLGGEHMAGRDAVVEAQLGRGRVIMFGFSPYSRSWPHATFKLFFNALYR